MTAVTRMLPDGSIAVETTEITRMLPSGAILSETVEAPAPVDTGGARYGGVPFYLEPLEEKKEKREEANALIVEEAKEQARTAINLPRPKPNFALLDAALASRNIAYQTWYADIFRNEFKKALLRAEQERDDEEALMVLL